MNSYARHYAAPRPQTELTSKRTTLAADGGTYYASERDLVLENAGSLKECLIRK